MNTASTIRSVVAGRSERLKHRVYEATGLGEVFNDSNVHLSIKSSPEKTAPALSLIAEREGCLLKLNDTGSWRKRRALLVPHTFLYYFGEQTAATDLRPHGVIDLELYTNIQVVDETMVKLAPGDEHSPIRTFYLRLPSEEEAQEWAQAIRETRFDYVRGERDALRSAKTGLTYQLVEQEETLRDTRGMLEASRRRESAAVSELARRTAEEARRVEQVRALLAASASASGCASAPGSCGDCDRHVANTESARTAGESSSSSGGDGGGGPICAPGLVLGGGRGGRGGKIEGFGGVTIGGGTGAGMGVGAAGSSVAATALSELAALEEAIAERAREVASLKRTNKSLREKEALAADQRRREVADALRLRDEERDRAAREASLRSDLEAELERLRAELEESRACRDEARANLGVVAAACREADAKAKELQEHRRVLAREVKASRAEQKRLSAALSCATKAASTAAATAAAATAAAATAATTAASETAGNQDRSSPVASCAACDGGTKDRIAVDVRGEREGGGGGGGVSGESCGGGNGGKAAAVGSGGCSGEPTPCAEQHGAENSEEKMAEGSPTNSSGKSSAVRRSTSSDDYDTVVCKGVAGPVVAATAAASADAAPPSIPPPPLGTPGASLQQGAGEGSAGGTGSGAVSGIKLPGTAGGDEDGERPALKQLSPSHSLDGSRVEGHSVSAVPAGSPSARAGRNLVLASRLGGEGVDAESDGAREAGSREFAEDDGKGGGDDDGRTPLHSGTPASQNAADSGHTAAATTAAAAAPASPSASLTAAFGESSSLRFNQMVKSFSAGLRESRRARRTPLLGSLDDDDDGGSDYGATAVNDTGEDDGGVTDGTGTDGGDSRHDSTASCTREGSEASSIQSTVGDSSSSCCCHGQQKEQDGVALAAGSGGLGSEDGVGCALDGAEGCSGDSLEAAKAETAAAKPAVVVAGIIPAPWLQVLGRADGEDDVGAPGTEDGSQTQEVGGGDSPFTSPPERERVKSEGGGRGDGGGGTASAAASASASMAVALAEEDGDSGVSGAAVAVALAAAERGGALSAEAAAAARRWEAKLKGSLAGVRWGLGPQRRNDDTVFNS